MNNNLDNIFLSYNEILKRLQILGKTTKSGKEITHKDLRKAICVMEDKHSNCRWKSEKIRSKRHYILIEGFYWLIYVYFNKDKKLMDADIDFFKSRIKQYEELLKVESKEIFTKDMYVYELEKYFSRKPETIKKAISKMLKYADENYRYIENGKYKISKCGIEWLYKNCFKQKYLELLEEYKMELTEKYIEAGYIYDNFFGIN